ncbi:hypothetical protein AAZX31_09G062900 [Glycine max]
MTKKDMKMTVIVIMIMFMLIFTQVNFNLSFVQIELNSYYTIMCDVECVILRIHKSKYRKFVYGCHAKCHKICIDVVYNCISDCGLTKYLNDNINSYSLKTYTSF